MFFVFSCLCGAACPEGTNFYYDQEFNLTVDSKSFAYFYTNRPHEREKPLRLMVKSEHPVKVAAEHITICPNATTKFFLETGGGPKWYTGESYFQGHATHALAVGIYSDERQVVYVRLLGQHRVNKSRMLTLQLLGVLAVMVLATGIFFCYCILPPPAHKQKVD